MATSALLIYTSALVPIGTDLPPTQAAACLPIKLHLFCMSGVHVRASPLGRCLSNRFYSASARQRCAVLCWFVSYFSDLTICCLTCPLPDLLTDHELPALTLDCLLDYTYPVCPDLVCLELCFYLTGVT